MRTSQLGNCRSCKRQIIWMKTSKGKNIPVDIDEYSEGETHFNAKTMTSHFATCPQSDKWRKP